MKANILSVPIGALVVAKAASGRYDASVRASSLDMSNPDAWKAYEDFVRIELINLDDNDGLGDLDNACDEHRDTQTSGSRQFLRAKTVARKCERDAEERYFYDRSGLAR